MAIKGLVDLEAYAIGGYATPETYYHISSGEYVEHDYSVLNYTFEAQTLTSSFSVSCEGSTEVNSAILTSSFTVSAAGVKFDFGSATITSSSSMSAFGGRIRTGQTNPSASATTTQNAVATFHGSLSAVSSFTNSTNAIYQAFSESLTLNAFVTQIQLAGKLIEAGTSITPRTSEYTWADFKESDVIDRAWTDWFGDSWGGEKRIVLVGAASVLKALGGYRAFASGNMATSATMPDVTMNRIRSYSASPTATTSSSVNGNATFGPTKEVTASATQSTDGKRFRGVSSGGNPFQMPMGTFSSSTNGIYFRASGSGNPVAVASVSGVGSVTFDLAYGQGITAAFSQSTDANFTAQLQPTELFALYSTLSEGRLISPADPWNTIIVPQELRTISVPIETRQFVVPEETRLNKVNQETRVAQVQQETRTRKIFKPVYTNRSSIPRVRSET